MIQTVEEYERANNQVMGGELTDDLLLLNVQPLEPIAHSVGDQWMQHTQEQEQHRLFQQDVIFHFTLCRSLKVRVPCTLCNS